MEETESLYISQDSLETQFKEHLIKADNYRVLFSGPFGQGKTTFLNKVFEDEQTKYHTIKLYPVNYSVSTNEDVFELIKFDILTQLIGKYGDNLDLKEEDFSKLLTAQIFIRDKVSWTMWIEALLSSFGTIGKSASGFLKAFKETVKDFESFHQEVQINETRKLEDFVDSLIAKSGSVYEMDIVSQKIKEFVTRLQRKSFHKIILVIDDLDRLDPEHIFRLFNVFSTQFEQQGENFNGYNKFGFDRIIFVCDIENIRRIYQHKYGAGVDFKGYLDKFYSHQPFDFDNCKFIQDRIKDVFHGLNFIAQKAGDIKEDTRNGSAFMSLTEWIFINLISHRFLNLRALIQVTDIEIKDIPLLVGGSNKDSSGYRIIMLFQLLSAYFPSMDILYEKLRNLIPLFNKNLSYTKSYRNFDSDWLISYMTSHSIPFLADPQITMVNYWPSENPNVLYSDDLNCYLHFSIREDFYNRDFDFNFTKATVNEDENSKEIELNPFEVLACTLLTLKKIGILK